jgi:hypothetical protein
MVNPAADCCHGHRPGPVRIVHSLFGLVRMVRRWPGPVRMVRRWSGPVQMVLSRPGLVRMVRRWPGLVQMVLSRPGLVRIVRSWPGPVRIVHSRFGPSSSSLPHRFRPVNGCALRRPPTTGMRVRMANNSARRTGPVHVRIANICFGY